MSRLKKEKFESCSGEWNQHPANNELGCSTNEQKRTRWRSRSYRSFLVDTMVAIVVQEKKKLNSVFVQISFRFTNSICCRCLD